MRTVVTKCVQALLFALIAVDGGACGPELAASDDAAHEEFLDAAEQSIDVMCTRLEACEESIENNNLIIIIAPFPNDSCYEPLLSSTERIYRGNRCKDPETMLAFYDCIAELECPSVGAGREHCVDELAAIEAALCYPF